MTRNLLYLVVCLDSLSFSMTIASWAPYIFALGGTQFFLGVLGSVSALVTLIWSPIVGSLSDRLGRRAVLIQLLAICVFANILMVLSSNLVVIFIAKVLSAFGSQIMALTRSLIDDTVKSQEERQKSISTMQIMGGVSFIFGGFLGGFLSEYTNGELYYAISAIFLINLAIVYSLNEEVKAAPQTKATGSAAMNELKIALSNFKNLEWSKYWDLFIIKLITDLSLNIYFFNSNMIMATLGITGKSIGYMFAFMSIMSISTSIIMIKLNKVVYSNDTSGYKRLQHGNILSGIAFVGLSQSTTINSYFLFQIPLSIARNLLETTQTEVLLTRVVTGEKGAVIGAFETTNSIAGLVAPLMCGIISKIWSESASFMLTIALTGLGAILILMKK